MWTVTLGGWRKQTEEGGRLGILLLVGGGVVFTLEYGTMSHVIYEKGKKDEISSPDHVIHLIGKVGFSRLNRIQDTGYTTRRAAQDAYMNLYFHALLPLDFPLVCVPYSPPHMYVHMCVCDTTGFSTAPLSVESESTSCNFSRR